MRIFSRAYVAYPVQFNNTSARSDPAKSFLIAHAVIQAKTVSLRLNAEVNRVPFAVEATSAMMLRLLLGGILGTN